MIGIELETTKLRQLIKHFNLENLIRVTTMHSDELGMYDVKLQPSTSPTYIRNLIKISLSEEKHFSTIKSLTLNSLSSMKFQFILHNSSTGKTEQHRNEYQSFSSVRYEIFRILRNPIMLSCHVVYGIPKVSRMSLTSLPEVEEEKKLSQ